MYMSTMATMHDALMTQLVISNNHLLNKLSDALYSANFFSIRCVKSSEVFSFSDESSDPGVHDLSYTLLCCGFRGGWYRFVIGMGAIAVERISLEYGPWYSMWKVRDGCRAENNPLIDTMLRKTAAKQRLRSCTV